jgi:hypothetical protein
VFSAGDRGVRTQNQSESPTQGYRHPGAKRHSATLRGNGDWARLGKAFCERNEKRTFEWDNDNLFLAIFTPLLDLPQSVD